VQRFRSGMKAKAQRPAHLSSDLQSDREDGRTTTSLYCPLYVFASSPTSILIPLQCLVVGHFDSVAKVSAVIRPHRLPGIKNRPVWHQAYVKANSSRQARR